MSTRIEKILTKYSLGEHVCGFHIKLATSLNEVIALSRVIRGAWGLSDGDEPYFYSLFNTPDVLFSQVLSPSLRAKNYKEISCLSMVAISTDNGVAGTASLVLNHVDKSIEFGRDATSVDFQRRGIQRYLTEMRCKLLHELALSYMYISDSTTLSLGVQKNLDAASIPAIAFHPSSFIIQSENVKKWTAFLSKKHSHEVAQAILIRSKQSKLGRFGTFFHVFPSFEDSKRIKKPFIPTTLSAFLEFTQQRIGSNSVLSSAQRKCSSPKKVYDNKLTATRVVSVGKTLINPLILAKNAKRDLFDTLIVRVPCDNVHLTYHQNVLDSGFIPGGIFPNTQGDWYMSYTYILEEDMLKKISQSLSYLRTSNYSFLAIENNRPMVELVYGWIHKHHL